MNKADEYALISILLSSCVCVLTIFFVVILKDSITFKVDRIKYLTTFLPRLFIRILKIRHKHNYTFYDSEGCDLSDNFSIYKCIWCGDVIHKL